MKKSQFLKIQLKIKLIFYPKLILINQNKETKFIVYIFDSIMLFNLNKIIIFIKYIL